MIKVFIPSQVEFQYYKSECKNLYEKVQSQITDTNTFEFIINNTLFYIYTDNNKLIGASYFFVKDDGNLYFNGFANRKMHDLCIKCLKMTLNWFKGSIYAEAQNRASALCLVKCGFKRVKDNLFVFNSKL